MMLEQDRPQDRPDSNAMAADPLSGRADDAGESMLGSASRKPVQDSMPASQVNGAVAESADPVTEEPPERPTIPFVPPAREALALDNARGGRWAMNEYFDGLVLLGADGRPVMRQDRTRVGFFFADAPRLAERLAREQGAPPDPRRALAPLDAGFNDDWDPQIQTSYFATMTKMTRLMAYEYVRTTEPEEAVRKAVATIFGNPRHIDEPGMKVWVPGKYDVAAVKSVANMLRRGALGSDAAEGNETGVRAARADVVANMALVATGMPSGLRHTTRGRFGGIVERAPPNLGSAIPEPQVDQGQTLVDIDFGTYEMTGITPVAEKNIFPPVADRPRFRAGVGPQALGAVGRFNPRAEHEPLHFHLTLPDGREARFLADTFEVFPGDERKATKEHYKAVKDLTEDQRWFVTKATRDIYETGAISPKTHYEAGQRMLRKFRPPGDRT